MPHCLSHHRKIRLRLLQNLVSLTEFAHLTLQLLNPGFLSRRLTPPLATIALSLTHPNPKAVQRTTQSTCNRRQRRSFALILIAVFHHQPHRAFAELG